MDGHPLEASPPKVDCVMGGPIPKSLKLHLCGQLFMILNVENFQEPILLFNSKIYTLISSLM